MPQEFEKNNSLIEILYLSSTVLFIWFWTNNIVLSAYSLQLTAFLIIFYFVTRFFLAKKSNSVHNNLFLDTIVFTAILLLVLSATNGLASPLFFVIYFYLFAFALLFEPSTTIVVTIGLSLFFLNQLNSINSVLQLFSLLLFSPLAIYFGRQYLKLLQSQEKIKILVKKSRQLSAINSQQSADIASEETNSLLWLSLDFKDSLLKVIHHTVELLSDIGHLTLSQKEHLSEIHQTAKNILKSGEKLQKQIDRETD